MNLQQLKKLTKDEQNEILLNDIYNAFEHAKKEIPNTFKKLQKLDEVEDYDQILGDQIANTINSKLLWFDCKYTSFGTYGMSLVLYPSNLVKNYANTLEITLDGNFEMPEDMIDYL